ncbi:MAG TPA: hypothetical protein VHP13_04355 [Gammaproteobacteria bacterium]|jgi:hypothetical protein|nr:hypothetical protein [Gammaproteobacteria bacterium]
MSTQTKKRFGIRCTLPPDDPMSAPHLLGPDWVAERWYASEQERDEALAEFSNVHIYSRRGDKPSVVYTKISR